ncbi:MAG: translation elongation factor Ts [Spirochaetia bacterium]|nr:translation elongation factor Ts [Spirochaetia bacterium]
MAEISKDLVKDLREKTGAGMNDCLNALKQTNGDMEKATEVLRQKGIASADKKTSRKVKEGLVYAYIHGGGRVGTMVEINCETDFVARTVEFEELCKEVAMQVAAMSPRWVRREDVPAEVVAKEKEIYAAQMADQKKPPQVIAKIIDGKLEKFYKDFCLLEQPYIKDDTKSVDTLVKEKIGTIGENIVVKRFARFVLGEI